MSQECGRSDVYCPVGSSLPLPVSKGYYSTGGKSEATRSAIEICEEGTFCAKGEKYLCPSGSYGSTLGLYSDTVPTVEFPNTYMCSGKRNFLKQSQSHLYYCLSCIGLCASGHYCPAGSTKPTQIKCPAGRYGLTAGLTTELCTAICPIGHFCPSGTSIPIKCASGNFLKFLLKFFSLIHVIIFADAVNTIVLFCRNIWRHYWFEGLKLFTHLH